jgi:hypothetical protein
MALEILFDNPNSQLVKVRDSDKGEYWLQRRKIRQLKSGTFVRCADLGAAQRRRAEEGTK